PVTRPGFPSPGWGFACSSGPVQEVAKERVFSQKILSRMCRLNPLDVIVREHVADGPLVKSTIVRGSFVNREERLRVTPAYRLYQLALNLVPRSITLQNYF